MSNELSPKPKSGQALTYHIRLEGKLGKQWSDWLEGAHITQEHGETLLTCSVTDQSALFGLLRKVRDLGIPLISVTQTNPDPAETPTTKKHVSNK